MFISALCTHMQHMLIKVHPRKDGMCLKLKGLPKIKVLIHKNACWNICNESFCSALKYVQSNAKVPLHLTDKHWLLEACKADDPTHSRERGYQCSFIFGCVYQNPPVDIFSIFLKRIDYCGSFFFFRGISTIFPVCNR